MTTTVATDYDNIEIQQQYSDVNNRWDVDDWDNENSSARLFERSRIKALAGKHSSHEQRHCMYVVVWDTICLQCLHLVDKLELKFSGGQVSLVEPIFEIVSSVDISGA